MFSSISLVVVLKIWAFFTYFNLVLMWGGRGLYISVTDIQIDKYVKNANIFKTTTQKINSVDNLITFSIVFTNKNEGDRFTPPPPPSKVRIIS